MVQLGCNYSLPLLSLLAAGEVEVDWIKLSREDTLEQEVAECQSVRPALVHTPGRAGMLPERFARVDWDRLNRAIEEGGSPHLAIHFGIHPGDLGELDPRDQGRVLERMYSQIRAAASHVRVPLLLENPDFPDLNRLPAYCAEPEVIRFALEQTDTGLLLDTAHLRCSAHNLGRDPFAYAEALPLDRVREIHVTGPRLEDGVMQDSHAELQDEDYALTAWLLKRTAPLVLTLEYGGTGQHYQQPGMSDPDALRRQLHRLKGMLA